jgi:hypothetical protein
VLGINFQKKNLVMTNIAESETDERLGTGQPATVELTGFPLRVKQILAPTDLTKDSRKGLRYATALAKHFNAKLTVLHVIEELHSLDHGPGGEVLPEDAFQELQVAGQKLNELSRILRRNIRQSRLPNWSGLSLAY